MGWSFTHRRKGYTWYIHITITDNWWSFSSASLESGACS